MNIYPIRFNIDNYSDNKEISTDWMKKMDLKNLEQDVEIEERYLERLFHDPKDFSDYLDRH